jgi:DNA-binding NarL/FixJ family response regulator
MPLTAIGQSLTPAHDFAADWRTHTGSRDFSMDKGRNAGIMESSTARQLGYTARRSNTSAIQAEVRIMVTKILLADDHQIVREGLKSLLNSHEDMQVVGEARDGRSAVQMAKDLSPDVVIMDVGMPHLNGIEATRQITSREPEAKVVALSMHADRRFMGEMLKAGAKGYLLKDGAFEELATAIRSVVANKVYLSPRIANVMVDDYVHRSPSQPNGDASAFARLTPREREVLQLMAEGRATKEIAMDLKVSIKTVETHRRQIMEKLSIHSVAELTKYAIREGLTSLDA